MRGTRSRSSWLRPGLQSTLIHHRSLNHRVLSCHSTDSPTVAVRGSGWNGLSGRWPGPLPLTWLDALGWDSQRGSATLSRYSTRHTPLLWGRRCVSEPSRDFGNPPSVVREVMPEEGFSRFSAGRRSTVVPVSRSDIFLKTRAATRVCAATSPPTAGKTGKREYRQLNRENRVKKRIRRPTWIGVRPLPERSENPEPRVYPT